MRVRTSLTVTSLYFPCLVIDSDDMTQLMQGLTLSRKSSRQVMYFVSCTLSLCCWESFNPEISLSVLPDPDTKTIQWKILDPRSRTQKNRRQREEDKTLPTCAITPRGVVTYGTVGTDFGRLCGLLPVTDKYRIYTYPQSHKAT